MRRYVQSAGIKPRASGVYAARNSCGSTKGRLRLDLSERLMFVFGSVLSQFWYPIRLLDRQPENSQGLSQPKI